MVATGLPSVTWAESVEAAAATVSAVAVAVLGVPAVAVERRGLRKKLNRVSVGLIPWDVVRGGSDAANERERMKSRTSDWVC